MDPVLEGEGPAVAASPLPIADDERAWLEERRSLITATDVAAILGLSPFSSPIKVWLGKTSESEDVAETKAMRWGRRFERPILEAYEERTGFALDYPTPFTLVRAPTEPLIGATLDAVRRHDLAPVDAKNVGFRSEIYGEDGSDDFPPHYAAQLMIQMFVTGAEVAELAVLFSRYDFRVYRLAYDRETAEGLVARCLDWRAKYVVPRITPPVDGTPDYTAFVKRIRQATDMVLAADPEQDKLARELATTKEKLELLGMEKDRIENVLKTAIGDAKGIEGPKWRALWSTTKESVGPDYERIARRLAENYVAAEDKLAQAENGVYSGLTVDGVLRALANDITRVTRAGFRRFNFTFKG
jgi:putative phage-type endonuclease